MIDSCGTVQLKTMAKCAQTECIFCLCIYMIYGEWTAACLAILIIYNSTWSMFIKLIWV